MARSSKIYLLYEGGLESDGMPIAAFTVKHEAMTYINVNFPNKENLVLYEGIDGRNAGWLKIEIT